MIEIRVWKWQYTDERGERRTSRWLMTEREAMRLRDAVRLQHTLQVRYDEGSSSSPSSRSPSSPPPLAARIMSYEKPRP